MHGTQQAGISVFVFAENINTDLISEHEVEAPIDYNREGFGVLRDRIINLLPWRDARLVYDDRVAEDCELLGRRLLVDRVSLRSGLLLLRGLWFGILLRLRG